MTIKPMLLSVLLIGCAASNAVAMDTQYPHLKLLGEDSLVFQKCQYGSILPGDTKQACDNLENTLRDTACADKIEDYEVGTVGWHSAIMAKYNTNGLQLPGVISTVVNSEKIYSTYSENVSKELWRFINLEAKLLRDRSQSLKNK